MRSAGRPPLIAFAHSLSLALACLCAFSPAAPPPAADNPRLDVRGERFLLDDKPFDVWGVRVASATKDDAQTDHLVAQLDEYKAHGVNTVSVFYQGSSGGN